MRERADGLIENRIADWIQGLPKPVRFGILVAFVFGLGALDTYLPRQLSLALLHVLPVFLCVWFVGTGASLAMAAIASIVWFASDELSAFAPPTLTLSLYDLGVKLSFFLLICLLIQRTKKSVERAEELSRCDALTGIANRRGLFEFAEREMERARRHERPLTLVYLDVDDFKTVNDQFGHESGDRLLLGIANALRGSIRRTDLIARLGGDEFAILLTETGPEGAQAAIESFQMILHDYLKTSRPPSSVSIGVVTFHTPPSSFDEMLRAADDLMYDAKIGQKGTMRFREYAGSDRVAVTA